MARTRLAAVHAHEGVRLHLSGDGNSVSGYKGVYQYEKGRHGDNRRFYAWHYSSGQKRGPFDNAIDAAVAYAKMVAALEARKPPSAKRKRQMQSLKSELEDEIASLEKRLAQASLRRGNAEAAFERRVRAGVKAPPPTRTTAWS